MDHKLKSISRIKKFSASASIKQHTINTPHLQTISNLDNSQKYNCIHYMASTWNIISKENKYKFQQTIQNIVVRCQSFRSMRGYIKDTVNFFDKRLESKSTTIASMDACSGSIDRYRYSPAVAFF